MMYNIIEKTITASTNDDARELVASGVPDNTIVVAEEQTKGRGRQGREWVSQKGNLFCSFVVYPKQSIKDYPLYSFVMALAVRDTVQEFLRDHIVQVKWPNDVLVDEKKIAGLLLEIESLKSLSPAQQGERLGEGGQIRSICQNKSIVENSLPSFLTSPPLTTFRGRGTSSMIIGVGVNCAHAPDNAQFPATSLKAENAPVQPKEFLNVLCRTFTHWRSVFDADGFDPIRKEWIEHAWKWQQDITIRQESGVCRGKLIDMAEDGALVLECQNSIVRITSGDVWS